MKKQKISIYTILKGVFLAAIVFATLYPFVYMAAVSTSETLYVLRNEISFYPKGFNLKMYKMVFENERILRGYLNTIIYTVTGSALSLTLTSMGAYALSKKKMVGHRVFSMMILFTMFFGGGMIPTFLLVKGLGMYDKIWALIVPGAISTWYLLIMRTFFVQFPVELEESGKLDGLNDLNVFFRLVLPLSKPVLATIGLFYAVGIWNAYFGALLYISTESKMPLQIILRNMLLLSSQYDNKAVGAAGEIVVEESLKYATVIVSVLPIVIVYPFLQRYFVKGVMIGSLKG